MSISAQPTFRVPSVRTARASFQRIKAVYDQRNSLHLDPEALRLVEWDYQEFVHSGANLSETQKAELKKLNEQIAVLQDDFETKLLSATKAGAYVTKDKSALAGMNDAQIDAAAEAAKGRNVDGYVIPLQNTTQQPALVTVPMRLTGDQGWAAAKTVAYGARVIASRDALPADDLEALWKPLERAIPLSTLAAPGKNK